MLTAKSDERDELQGFQLGVDEYISKAVQPEDPGGAGRGDAAPDEPERPDSVSRLAESFLIRQLTR